MKKLSSEYEVLGLALHCKVGASYDFERFYQVSGNIVQHLGFDSKTVMISGKSFPKRNLSAHKADEILRQTGFKAVQGIWLESASSVDEKPGLLRLTLDSEQRVALLTLPKVKFDVEVELLPTIKSLASCSDVAYGYSFVLNSSDGPEFYPFGIAVGTFGRWSDEEEEMMARWGHDLVEDCDHAAGLLRDVYEHNFLSAIHLKAKVEGVELLQWIQKNAGHGTITRITDDLWVWNVAKKSIAAIRTILRDHRILIAYRDDF